MPHSCQVRTASAALFCLCSTVVFTNQPRALQLFSAAVSPHTERCAGWLATPVRTRAYAVRFAHSNVASLNSSSHGLQLMTQAVAAAAIFLNISGCAWVGNVGDSTACHPQTLSKFWYSPKSMHIQVSSICCPMTTTLQLKLPRKLSKKHLYRAQTSIHIPTAFLRIYEVDINASSTSVHDHQCLASLKLTRLKTVDAN